MRIDILTLFPEMFDKVLYESIIGRACNKGILDIRCHQIRDYTENKQKQVDDYPYGGGKGCVMMAQPLKACLDAVMADAGNEKSRVIYLSPQGKPFTQTIAKRLRDDYSHLILVCGHYEGVDERFIIKCVDEEISIGDFVMTGGEIAAMAVTDSVCRLVPGVLSDEECYTGESHWDGLLEYPQYTRPELWEDLKVPDVLVEGDHSKIEKWRYEQQLRRTKEKRPDLFESLELDEKTLRSISNPEMNLSFRKASLDDLSEIMRIVSDSKEYLKAHKVDQWQGDYPEEKDFISDIETGDCYVVENGDELTGLFTLRAERLQNYSEITDGKWYSDSMEYCVLHRAALKAEYRGTGASVILMRFAETVCSSLGLRCIRTDTHKKNKAMQKLLRDSNYKYRGNVQVYCEPGHDTLRQAYEKVLKK